MTGVILVKMAKCHLRSISYFKCLLFTKFLRWSNMVKLGQPHCLAQVEEQAHNCMT